jgi:hypothetical protein
MHKIITYILKLIVFLNPDLIMLLNEPHITIKNEKVRFPMFRGTFFHNSILSFDIAF